MSKPRLIRVRHDKWLPEKPNEIIFSFDNDRHHMVRIENGLTRDQLSEVLGDFVNQLLDDENLS
jgi:hypothetical protein